jgi:hypothetical protein
VVTLNEAYRYTYTRTIAATVPSVWGPQHPSYDYRLAGTGELVLTRVSSGRTALVLPAGAGVVYFVQNASAEIVAEISPPDGRRLRVALRPGRYRLVAHDKGRSFAADVRVPESGDVAVERVALREVRPELALAKGAVVGRNDVLVDLTLAGLGPGVFATSGEVGVGWFRRGVRWSYGARAGYGRSDVSLPAIAFTLDRVRLTGELLRRFAMGSWELQLGAGLGGAIIHETVTQRFASSSGSMMTVDNTATAPTGSLSLALEVPLRPWLPLRVAWGGAFDLTPIDGAYRIVPELRASVATGVRF